MGIIRRPWLSRASGGNLATGVTPLLFYEKCHGIFNDHRESGPRFNISSERRCFFDSIVSRHYTGALGPTQTTGWAPPAGLTNTSSSSNLVFNQQPSRYWPGSTLFSFTGVLGCRVIWLWLQMGYSSRRLHRVPLLSTKNRKRRLQFTQAYQNWRIEDWKNVAWSDESRFLLWHSDGRVRIWHKKHDSMDPSCLVSMVQGGGVMWGIFSWHTLGTLVPIEHCLNATVYLSIVADLVHPFMTTVYPFSDGYFLQDNVPCHKAQIISDCFLEHDNELTLLKWPPQSPDLNPIEHLWDVVEREIRIMDVQPTNLQQLHDAIMSI